MTRSSTDGNPPQAVRQQQSIAAPVCCPRSHHRSGKELIDERAQENGRVGSVTWRSDPDPIPRERTFRLKGDAERFERRTIREMETGDYLDPWARKITSGNGRSLAADHRVQYRAPSTIAGYEPSLRIQVLPDLRDVPIKDLRKIHIQEWLGQLRAAGYSGSTIHIAKTAAGMVLTTAVDRGSSPPTPWRGSGSPRDAVRPVRP